MSAGLGSGKPTELVMRFPCVRPVCEGFQLGCHVEAPCTLDGADTGHTPRPGAEGPAAPVASRTDTWFSILRQDACFLWKEACLRLLAHEGLAGPGPDSMAPPSGSVVAVAGSGRTQEMWQRGKCQSVQGLVVCLLAMWGLGLTHQTAGWRSRRVPVKAPCVSWGPTVSRSRHEVRLTAT